MIILSCGHEIDDFDHSFSVMTKYTDRRGEKALNYSMVCGPCEDRYRRFGDLFDTEQQAEEWLKKEEW